MSRGVSIAGTNGMAFKRMYYMYVGRYVKSNVVVHDKYRVLQYKGLLVSY